MGLAHQAAGNTVLQSGTEEAPSTGTSLLKSGNSLRKHWSNIRLCSCWSQLHAYMQPQNTHMKCMRMSAHVHICPGRGEGGAWAGGRVAMMRAGIYRAHLELTEDVVHVGVACFVSAHRQQQVPHLGAFPQSPVLHRDLRCLRPRQQTFQIVANSRNQVAFSELRLAGFTPAVTKTERSYASLQPRTSNKGTHQERQEMNLMEPPMPGIALPAQPSVFTEQ